jgi:N6-L-threonylcarbamoyladenine synthase
VHAAQVRADIAASFQRAAVVQLAQRVKRGIAWARETEPALSCLIISGGVAANAAVRGALDGVAAAADLPARYPPVALCTDNGALWLRAAAAGCL